MNSFTYEQYLEKECKVVVVSDAIIGLALVAETKGRLCDDCSYFNNGGCQSYIALTSTRRPVIDFGETVKEEAKRTGLSIRKVRDRRRDLTYDLSKEQ